MISLEDSRDRRQLFYGFDLPGRFSHTHKAYTRVCIHTQTHRCCFPWKHNTINKRNVFPLGKPSRSSSIWPSELQGAPRQFTTGLEEATRSQRTSLCSDAPKDRSHRGRGLPQILCFSSLGSPPTHQPLGIKSLYIRAE